MNEERKQQIATMLKEKGVKLPCPQCSSLSFEVVDQAKIPISDNLDSTVVSGPPVPAAIVACSQCGFITFHSLGLLKLLPNE